MKLSIAVPTFNKADYLTQLLDSLLQQDYPQNNFEVIIVNDGSTDHTATVIAHYQPLFANFQVVTQTNKGIGAARNAGIRAAMGELIAFVADDYVLTEDYCSCLVAAFEDEQIIGIRADLGSVGTTAIEKVWLNRTRLGLWHALQAKDAPLGSGFSKLEIKLPEEITTFQQTISWCGGSMMRRWIFDRYGLFREDLETGEDSEMGKRLASHGIRLHFYPKRLLSVAFRSGYAESVKRLYQYSKNGRTISRMKHNASLPKRSLWQQANSFVQGTLRLIRMADNKSEAVQMLPLVLLTRLMAIWVRLRA